MLKEPYYIPNASSSHIKPPNARCYSFVSHDIPSISPKSLISAPDYDWAASTTITKGNGRKIHLRSNSIEPYYVKSRKIGTLPPVITGPFTYQFGEPPRTTSDDDCAIVSDDEDENIDDAKLGNPNIVPPPSSYHGSLSRKVSDNYTNSLDSESDEDTPKFKVYFSQSNLVTGETSHSSFPYSKSFTQPPHLHDLEELKQILLSKSDNPNVLINPIARSVSNRISPPQFCPETSSDIYEPVPPKIEIRDDYDYAPKRNFLI